LIVDTTAVFLPAEAKLLIAATSVCQSECPKGVAQSDIMIN